MGCLAEYRQYLYSKPDHQKLTHKFQGCNLTLYILKLNSWHKNVFLLQWHQSLWRQKSYGKNLAYPPDTSCLQKTKQVGVPTRTVTKHKEEATGLKRQEASKAKFSCWFLHRFRRPTQSTPRFKNRHLLDLGNTCLFQSSTLKTLHPNTETNRKDNIFKTFSVMSRLCCLGYCHTHKQNP